MSVKLNFLSWFYYFVKRIRLQVFGGHKAKRTDLYAVGRLHGEHLPVLLGCCYGHHLVGWWGFTGRGCGVARVSQHSVGSKLQIDRRYHSRERRLCLFQTKKLCSIEHWLSHGRELVVAKFQNWKITKWSVALGRADLCVSVRPARGGYMRARPPPPTASTRCTAARSTDCSDNLGGFSVKVIVNHRHCRHCPSRVSYFLHRERK